MPRRALARSMAPVLRAVAPLALALLLAASVPAVAPAAAWGGLHVQASGAAGEWLLAYRPLPAPVTGITFDVVVDLTAAGPSGPPVVAMLEASPVFDYEGGPRLDNPFTGPKLYTRAEGGALTVRLRDRASQGGPPIVGFAVVASASAPWSLDARIVHDATLPVEGPSFLSRGGGAVFAADASHLTVVPTPAAGQVSLAKAYATPGWTHVQVAAKHLQPDGVRDFRLAFPNGNEYVGMGFAAGANAVVVGSWFENGYWGGYGTQRDTPGTFAGTVTYASASAEAARLAMAHLPLGAPDYPAGFQMLLEYGANEWIGP